MKKLLTILLLTSLCLAFQGGTIAEPANQQPQPQLQNTALLEYHWYNDPFYTDFNGSIASLENELQRVRATYPGWLFKAVPDIGYAPFEWGRYSPSITAIIYCTY